MTATTNTKVYDGSTSADAIPTVTLGTVFSPDVKHFTEAYNSATAGTETLTATGTVDDGFGGADYTYEFIQTDGTITQAIPKLVYGVFNLVDGKNTYSEIVGDINAHGGHAYYGITDDSNHRVDGTFSTIPVSGAVSGTTTPLYINIMFTPNDVTNFSTVNQTAEFGM